MDLANVVADSHLIAAAAVTAAGANDATPYTLRHSFCSLLLAESRSVIYVARQLGHGAALTLGTYGHVIDELEGAERVDAEAAIRAAREALVPVSYLRAASGES
jgi:integrase